MLDIKAITSEGEELDIIRRFFKDYQAELEVDLCFQQFDAELLDPLKKYAPPSGALFLATWNNEVAGCIALQDLGHKVCEMKRLYVKPSFRKHRIGEALALRLLHTAKGLGYTTMRLDTLQKLQPAIKLYQKLGFHKANAYYQNPNADVVYMEKTL
jgi:putative acetyltransferase